MSEFGVEEISYRLNQSGLYVPERSNIKAAPGFTEDITFEDLAQRLEEGNETYTLTEDSSGRRHELVVFNSDKVGNGVVFRPSTMFSGVTKNPANVLETALQATFNPDMAFVLWTSYGNYKTDNFKDYERQYLRQTGRNTKGNDSDGSYAPLLRYEHLAEMLDKLGLSPTYMVASKEAGRVALGLMTAMPKDAVSGAYFDGITGISPAASYVVAPFLEDAKSRLQRRSIDETQPGELTPDNIKILKAKMPRIYSGIGKIAHLAPLPVILFPRDVRDVITSSIGYKAHNHLSNLPDHAVYQDLMAALERQRATIIMQFNSQSSQHKLDDCEVFGELAMNGIGSDIRDTQRQLKIWLGQGKWSEGTDSPHQASDTISRSIETFKNSGLNEMISAGIRIPAGFNPVHALRLALSA